MLAVPIPEAGLADAIDEIAAGSAFSGAVRIDRRDSPACARAYGFAHRALEIENTVDTQFGIASGGKGLTALAVVRLIEAGVLDLTTTARSVLGTDLPLIADDVTVEQLLAHRSGIGDYLDEDRDADVNDYVLTVPVHTLATTEQFLAVLDGFPSKFAAGTQFSYCNGGYVLLALIAERVSGVRFPDFVREQVCERAGMRDTEFLRSDELPARAALGYLDTEHPRTNVFHLPVRASGDGGLYSTVADLHAFWNAFFAGRIVSNDWVAALVRPRSEIPDSAQRYGLGFWLHATEAVVSLEGMDAGVSFRSVHDPARAITHTVISNTTDGAWPLTRFLDSALIERRPRQ
jgi:CubicO group peptidase (beta-lactamase class C family)